MTMLDKILDSMVSLKVISKEDRSVYHFGMECLFLKALHYSSYAVIGAAMGEVRVLLGMGCAFIPLRKSAGGYHAKTRSGCYLLSCMTVFVTLRIYSYKISNYLISICYFVGVAAILILAPLDNENKRMDEDERKYFKRMSRVVVGIITIIILLDKYWGNDFLGELLMYGTVVSAISVIAGAIDKKLKWNDSIGMQKDNISKSHQ